MVADSLLEFRFAIPRDFGLGGDYHDKVGVFIDASNDVVAIHGSYNDSAKGSLNGEAFSVFRSWEEGQRPFVERHRGRLMKLWKEGNAQFQVLPLPDAIRLEIVDLRTGERPYTVVGCESTGDWPQAEIAKPEVSLRPYQREAIDCWKEKGCRGIFEMATGTGKTFTALAAAAEKRDELNQVAVVILVPYLHLLNQWRQHCERFGFFPILCSGDHGHWPSEVRSKIQDYRLGGLPSICVLSVHQTAAAPRFASALEGLSRKSTLLIADEVHSLGAPRLRDALLSGVAMRMGLSATPRRWYDQEGTETLLNYFTNICYEYPLDRAIGEFLTPYRYFPILTQMTANEHLEYEQLSHRIAALSHRDLETDKAAEEGLKRLLLQRAQIVSAAENKLPLLLKALQEEISRCKETSIELKDVLIYCAPGRHKEVLRAVSTLGLRCHEFVHTVSMDKRQEVLQQFASGDIQALVAIHCLDEGVDIPSTRTAYFLASTSNPKEFIQRRGRILRKFEGKVFANVYDFLVAPDIEHAPLRRETDLGLLRREMSRFAEFAASAENEFHARAVVWNLEGKTTGSGLHS
ncbi:MAG: DEAD/DEAH box helicase family protein [Thermodesulfobacteriota bacterium]|nr:DEAD/DEAH box helicase family protein [Thermodesulfobacteriota bacterium]